MAYNSWPRVDKILHIHMSLPGSDLYRSLFLGSVEIVAKSLEFNVPQHILYVCRRKIPDFENCQHIRVRVFLEIKKNELK